MKLIQWMHSHSEKKMRVFESWLLFYGRKKRPMKYIQLLVHIKKGKAWQKMAVFHHQPINIRPFRLFFIIFVSLFFVWFFQFIFIWFLIACAHEIGVLHRSYVVKINSNKVNIVHIKSDDINQAGWDKNSTKKRLKLLEHRQQISLICNMIDKIKADYVITAPHHHRCLFGIFIYARVCVCMTL